MIVYKYIVKKDDFVKFRDILQSYCDEHKKKFNEFTVTIIWKRDDVMINKISVPQTNTLQRTDMFKPIMFEIPIYVRLSERKILDIIDKNCVYNIISDEIDIIFISEFKEMTLQSFIKQPRSMLCRKLEKNYIEEDNSLFNYNFLSWCFRNIGFQPSSFPSILYLWTT